MDKSKKDRHFLLSQEVADGLRLAASLRGTSESQLVSELISNAFAEEIKDASKARKNFEKREA